MKHSIRINGQIQTIACEFGSGIVDKNGREIFEGDIVRLDGEEGRVFPVSFEDAMHVVNHVAWLAGFAGRIEIVGHMED